MYNYINHKDNNCLLNMLDAIEKIKQYSAPHSSADEFLDNIQAFDASMMNFIVIGEMVEKLSEQLIDASKTDIDWFKIKGFRNILAHNYFGVDAEEVWQIIHNNLTNLEMQVKKMIT